MLCTGSESAVEPEGARRFFTIVTGPSSPIVICEEHGRWVTAPDPAAALSSAIESYCGLRPWQRAAVYPDAQAYGRLCRPLDQSWNIDQPGRA